MEEVNVSGKNPARNGTFAPLSCAIFRTRSFRKSLNFFGTSITSLDPETVQLPAFSILSAMFTGACGPPEKLSLALLPRLHVLRMIVILAYTDKEFPKRLTTCPEFHAKLCQKQLLSFKKISQREASEVQTGTPTFLKSVWHGPVFSVKPTIKRCLCNALLNNYV